MSYSTVNSMAAERGTRVMWRWAIGAAFAAVCTHYFLLVLAFRPIALDEFEFARATYWVSQGLVPYRDFWEHHSPLQWQIFAWVPWIASSEAIDLHVWLRLAQIPVWAAAAWATVFLSRRAGSSQEVTAVALLLLGTSAGFLAAAIEFRVDSVSTALVVGAIALTTRRKSGLIALGGACATLAVWANLRSVAVVAAIGFVLIAHALRGEPGAPRRAVSAAAGGGVTGGAILGYLFFTGSMREAWQMLAADNALVDEFLQGFALPVVLGALTRGLDLSGLILLILGCAGAAVAFSWSVRTRDASEALLRTMLPVAWALELAFVAIRGVVYPYHLQMLFVLSVPLAAIVLDTPVSAKVAGVSVGRAAAMVGMVALALNFALLFRAGPARSRLQLQRELTKLASERAGGGAILDGTAWVVHAKPAMRLWFLPAAARILTAAAGGLTAADLGEKPAVVIGDRRLAAWLRDWPRLGRSLTTHYVPETRDVWVRGCGARLDSGDSIGCELPEGRWRVYASPVLARHPWFVTPLQVSMAHGARASALEVDLAMLPAGSVSIDGNTIASGDGLVVRSLAAIRIANDGSDPVGVVVVPEDLTTVFRAPHGGLFPEPAIFDLRGLR